MGIGSLRKKLAQKATGRVLEVSCGTGRNVRYLIGNKSVEELHLADNVCTIYKDCANDNDLCRARKC